MTSLHPEWAAFIAQNPNISHDDDQRNGQFYAEPGNSDLVTRVIVQDTTIPGRDGHQIPIRLYTASDTATSQGVIIFYHSGGFTVGSLETEDITCRQMALTGPLTIISVEYRLSPENLYPVPINDGWDAFEYLVRNTTKLIPDVIQPLRLVIGGTSSGGQLAAIVSQRAQEWLDKPENAAIRTSVQLTGVLLRAPVTVRGTDPEFIPPKFRSLHDSWRAELETPRLHMAGMKENHDVLAVPDPEKTSPRAYPLWGRFEGLPRTYIQLCEIDILRDDGVCYAKALRDAGVVVEETLYKGLPHIFWVYGPDLGVARQAREDVVGSLPWLFRLES